MAFLDNTQTSTAVVHVVPVRIRETGISGTADPAHNVRVMRQRISTSLDRLSIAIAQFGRDVDRAMDRAQDAERLRAMQRSGPVLRARNAPAPFMRRGLRLARSSTPPRFSTYQGNF